MTNYLDNATPCQYRRIERGPPPPRSASRKDVRDGVVCPDLLIIVDITKFEISQVVNHGVKRLEAEDAT